MKRLKILTAVCLSFAPLSAQHRGNTAEQEVRNVLFEQVSAWNRGDLDGYMLGYWRSDSTEFVSGGSLTRGYDDVLSRYRRTYNGREAMGRLEFSELSVKVFAKTAAVVSGVWKLRRANDTPWGRFTLLVEKKSGSWRITHDHTSTAGE